MSALDQWLADTQAEVKTADGHVLTVVPVRIQDCLIAGAIPVPVLEEMAKLEASADEGDKTAEDKLQNLKTAQGMEDIYVQLAIKEFDHEPCELPLNAVARLGALDPAAFAEVLGIAARSIPAPGKD